MKTRSMRWTSITRRTAVGAIIAASLSLSAPQMATAGSVTVPAPGKSAIIDKIKDQGVLRAGIAIAPPWLLQDPKTGEHLGPIVEVGNRIAGLLGVELKLVPSGWAVIIAGLQAQQFELAIAPLFATPKRKKVVDFVNWTKAGTCYAVLQTNNKINSLEDLNKPSVTIGTWTGTGTEHGIKAKYTKAKIHSIVQSVGGAHRFEDVIAKRIDVAPLDDAQAFVTVKQFPTLKIIPGGPDHCVNNSDIPFPIGMGFNKKQPEFAKFLQAVVDDMKPEIQAALVKYSAVEYMLAE